MSQPPESQRHFVGGVAATVMTLIAVVAVVGGTIAAVGFAAVAMPITFIGVGSVIGVAVLLNIRAKRQRREREKRWAEE